LRDERRQLSWNSSRFVYTVAGHAAVITINRPDKLNAIDENVLTELSSALDAAETDPAIAGVVITGAGDKAFVAGADIARLRGLTVVTAKIFQSAVRIYSTASRNSGNPS